MYVTSSPVLLIVFNRPDQTAKVFNALRKVKPKRIYLSADGPRLCRFGETEKCEAVLNIFSAPDWPCEVHRKVHSTNIGCDANVLSGVNWFFENEEFGVVLEDDCVPNESFFRFCDKLLERYRNDNRIMWINGFNNGYCSEDVSSSYFYSSYALSSGWASWRRAWSYFRSDSHIFARNDGVSTFFPEHIKASYLTWLFWRYAFKYAKVSRAWDFEWLHSLWMQGGFACTPAKNLISNIGYGVDAYHGGSHNDPRGNLPTEELQGKFIFPPEQVPSVSLDIYLGRTFYRIGIYTIVKLFVASNFPRLRIFIRRIRNKSY